MSTIVCNDRTKEFFFSTQHSTPTALGPEWVPVSWVTRSRAEIKAQETARGYEEIKNPEPENQA